MHRQNHIKGNIFFSDSSSADTNTFLLRYC